MCRDTAVMNDDLGGPAAVAAVHATVRDGNYALSTGTWKTGDLPETGAGQVRGARTANPRPGGRSGRAPAPGGGRDERAGATNVMNFAELL